MKQNLFCKSLFILSITGLLITSCSGLTRKTTEDIEEENSQQQNEDNQAVQDEGIGLWSCYGAKYTAYLESIVSQISLENDLKIKHSSKGSMPGVLRESISAIATKEYPSMIFGQPDHFAQYHASKILNKFDSYLIENNLVNDLNDYFSNYLVENYIYDTDGTKHLYSLPFSRSSEVLVYNGVFVDYCAEKYNDPTLKILPTTWAEWDQGNDPTTKVGKYYAAFRDLLERRVKLYATQNEEGTATGFTETATDGKTLVLDYSDIDLNLTKLMTWDSLDNAFITLLRQWDAKYTELPADQYEVNPKRRQGLVLFANDENLPKTISMLKFFNNMYKKGIFGTPADLGSSFSSDAFAQGRVMFMITSSGFAGFASGNWSKRYRVAPIPYSDADHKFVISQGANICITKNTTNINDSYKIIKSLSTGKHQVEWAIKTGYCPVSKTAVNSTEYQAFLNGTSYDDKNIVLSRETAIINSTEYNRSEKNWISFIDEAFIGSAIVRALVCYIIPNAFKSVDDVDDDQGYKNVIKTILKDPQIANNPNIAVDSRLV